MADLTDDLTNQPGARRHTFSLDSDRYEIDLTDINWDDFTALFADYILAGRRVQMGARKAPVASDAAKIRAWAKDQGLNVGVRGRIPADVMAKWQADR